MCYTFMSIIFICDMAGVLEGVDCWLPDTILCFLDMIDVQLCNRPLVKYQELLL